MVRLPQNPVLTPTRNGVCACSALRCGSSGTLPARAHNCIVALLVCPCSSPTEARARRAIKKVYKPLQLSSSLGEKQEHTHMP
eukprot:990419-Pelagomonas_calceolata.AAC.2